ncbi:MAG: hypothetical protein WC734_05505 [Patescibacteria group bacterium]
MSAKNHEHVRRIDAEIGLVAQDAGETSTSHHYPTQPNDQTASGTSRADRSQSALIIQSLPASAE